MKPISQHADWVDAFNIGKYTEVSLDGDWHKLPRLFRNLGGGSTNRGIKRDIAKSMRTFTERYKKTLISGLASGGRAVGASWEFKSSDYSSASGIVGVHTGTYLGALTNLRITQNKYMMRLSFAKGDLNQKSTGRATLGQYSVWFEKGTRYQAPRPLWNLAFRKIGGQKRLLQGIKGAVGRRFKRLTI